jgi:hypothetical protein
MMYQRRAVKVPGTFAKFLLVLAIVLASVGIVSGTASASTTSSCNVRALTTSCKTGTLRVSSLHEVDATMCGADGHYADWQVKDADNGNIVAQGRVGPLDCATPRITGLFGRYYGWVFNTRSGAFASITAV